MKDLIQAFESDLDRAGRLILSFLDPQRLLDDQAKELVALEKENTSLVLENATFKNFPLVIDAQNKELMRLKRENTSLVLKNAELKRFWVQDLSSI